MTVRELEVGVGGDDKGVGVEGDGKGGGRWEVTLRGWGVGGDVEGVGGGR